MTIRTIITAAAQAVVPAIARIAGRVQLAARVDAAREWCFELYLAPLLMYRGHPKHLPVAVSLDQNSGRGLTRAPFPVYAAAPTGRRSC